MTGTLVHLELHTPDLPGACAYYASLLGWRAETVAARCRPYVRLDVGLSAGLVGCAVTRPVWLPYVEVTDVAAATDRAGSLGAVALLAPHQGPRGRRSVVRSPVAGDLAFWEPA